MNSTAKYSLVILAVLVVVGLLGCKSASRSPSPASTPVPLTNSRAAETTVKYPPRVTVNFTPSANPKKDLDDAIKRLATAFPYRATYSQTSGDRPTVEFIVEYEDANHFYLRDSSGGEAYMSGQSAISKYPQPPSEGHWIQDDSGKSVASLQEGAVQKNLPLATTNVRPDGKEDVNGVAGYVYTYSKASSDVSGKAWIGADGLLYQIDEVSKNFKQHYRFEYVDIQLRYPSVQ